MKAAYPVEQIRAAEAALMSGQPDGVLMQRAAAGLATECTRLLGGAYGRRVVLLVGGGNNGGDALFAGATLARRGVRVDAVLLDPQRAHVAGSVAFARSGGRVVTVAGAGARLDEADLIVDGVLGIGGRGGLREPAAGIAERAGRSGALVVAVDLPSGVDADTGAVAGAAVRADVTVTFGALKPGLLVGDGADRAGVVRWVDIGLGPLLPPAGIQVLEQDDVSAGLTRPGAASDKYTRGVVGVVAGSAQYGGAAVLSTGGALHGGAGMVRYVGAAGDAVRARWPEIVVHDTLTDAGRVQAWVVGPGLGTGDAALAALTHVMGTDVPVLVDADAITVLAAHRELLADRSAPTVLTPHDREFERLFGAVGDDRIGAARRAAADSGATVLLKGSATVVADPGGAVYVNPTGTPWLATAGSGDVLSGLTGSMIAGVVAADPSAPSAVMTSAEKTSAEMTSAAVTKAAAFGAYVHGVAGQLAAASGPPSAGDVLGALRDALHRIEGGS